MNDNLVDWITEEIKNRGWSIRELARRANLSHATISNILAQQTNPGFDFCVGIASAFDVPAEYVLRKAKLLPDLPYGPLEDMNLKEMYDLMRNLSPLERRGVLEYARMRYRIIREEQQPTKKDAGS